MAVGDAKQQHSWRYSQQVGIRKQYIRITSKPKRQNQPCTPTRNPVYTNRSRDHECRLQPFSNGINAHGGIGTAPSSTAARSSLPSSKDYRCPRLRQPRPPHCTSTRRLPIPRCAQALTFETVGAAPRWTREQWRSATKASTRRPSTHCKRKRKAKQSSGLI